MVLLLWSGLLEIDASFHRRFVSSFGYMNPHSPSMRTHSVIISFLSLHHPWILPLQTLGASSLRTGSLQPLTDSNSTIKPIHSENEESNCDIFVVGMVCNTQR